MRITLRLLLHETPRVDVRQHTDRPTDRPRASAVVTDAGRVRPHHAAHCQRSSALCFSSWLDMHFLETWLHASRAGHAAARKERAA